MSGVGPNSTILSPTQLSNIKIALEKNQAYIQYLQNLQNKNLTSAAASQLDGPVQDAINLQNQLIYLHSISEINALAAAITTAKQTTTFLQRQQAHIDTWAKILDAAADVIGVFAQVALAVAAI